MWSRLALFLVSVGVGWAATIPSSPITFSNITYTNSSSVGLPVMGFEFIPAPYPTEGFTSNNAVVYIPGRYLLDPVGVGEFVTETVSADFTTNGYSVVGVSGLGVIYTDGYGTNEHITINGPCRGVLVDDDFDGVARGGCSTPLLQSGTLSVTLDIRASQECNEGGRCKSGVVSLSFLNLSMKPMIHNPEPGFLGLVGLSTILLLKRLTHA